MDKFGDTAKSIAKSVVPEKVLHPLRERLSSKASTDGHATTVEAVRHDPSPRVAEPDFLTIDWLRAEIAAIEPALGSYFLVTADGAKPSLCAPTGSYTSLIGAVIAVGAQSQLDIGYMLNRKRRLVSDHEQLAQELSKMPFAQMRFISGGREFAFFVEEWGTEGSSLVAPRPNPVTKKVELNGMAADNFFASPGKSLDELFRSPMMEHCGFDVDVVYTWVNAQDPDWQQQFREHAHPTAMPSIDSPGDGGGGDGDDPTSDRFLSRDELRYSLRSLLHFAPWVGHVYIVSNCKPPEWFDEHNQRVRWIYHEEILDPAFLPTFNSHAIETAIHRVPNLSEHFLYFNDDIFVMRPVTKSDFFVANGIAKIRPEPYGIVQGSLDPNDPDYINAARNGQALLQAEFSKTATRPHTHSPQSMKRSVAQASEELFAEAFDVTRRNRFRSISDISPTSFLYPNFAYLAGKAVMDSPKTALLNANHPYRDRFQSYLDMLRTGRFAELPLTLCINDGGGSAGNDDWGQAIIDFMHAAFKGACEAEKSS